MNILRARETSGATRRRLTDASTPAPRALDVSRAAWSRHSSRGSCDSDGTSSPRLAMPARPNRPTKRHAPSRYRASGSPAVFDATALGLSVLAGRLVLAVTMPGATTHGLFGSSTSMGRTLDPITVVVAPYTTANAVVDVANELPLEAHIRVNDVRGSGPLLQVVGRRIGAQLSVRRRRSRRRGRGRRRRRDSARTGHAELRGRAAGRHVVAAHPRRTRRRARHQARTVVRHRSRARPRHRRGRDGSSGRLCPRASPANERRVHRLDRRARRPRARPAAQHHNFALHADAEEANDAGAVSAPAALEWTRDGPARAVARA